jgi:hypothetical protein
LHHADQIAAMGFGAIRSGSELEDATAIVAWTGLQVTSGFALSITADAMTTRAVALEYFGTVPQLLGLNGISERRFGLVTRGQS